MNLYPKGHATLKSLRETLYQKLTEVLKITSPLSLVITPDNIFLADGSALPRGIKSDRFHKFFESLGVTMISFGAQVELETLNSFMDYLFSRKGRLDEENLPGTDRFPGIILHLLDYRQLLKAEGSEAARREDEHWRRLLSETLNGRGENLSESDLRSLASLLDEEDLFAREAARILGDAPSPEAVANLADLMNSVRDFMTSVLGMNPQEVLDRIRKCLMALPAEIMNPLMELPLDSPERGAAVKDILRTLSLEEVVRLFSTSLASSSNSSLKRLAGVLELLSLDGDSRRRFLPALKPDLEAREGSPLSQERWRQIQNFLSPFTDQNVSVSYGRQLDQSVIEGKSRGAPTDDGLDPGLFLSDIKGECITDKAYWILSEDLILTEDRDTFHKLLAEITLMFRDQILRGRYAAAVDSIRFLTDMIVEAESAGPHEWKAEFLRTMGDGLLDEATLAAAVSRLEEASDNERPYLRQIFLKAPKAAAKALAATLGNEGLPDARRFRVSLLAELGQFSRSEAFKLLNESRWQVVCDALSLMAEMKDPSAVARIVPLLRHRDVRVKKSAIKALQVIGTTAGRESLLKVLEDPDRELVREVSLYLATGDFKPSLVKNLLEKAGQGNFFGRKDRLVMAAVEALGIIRAAEAVPQLERLLTFHRRLFFRSRRDGIALAAAHALAAIGGKEARAVLEKACRQERRKVAAACRQCLDEMAKEEE